ncbi:MAG: hypothetical protein IPL65_13710 [Lewinellaceae bacterium]|nr:hypothetical protein [Lewinellaceae bacterium]
MRNPAKTLLLSILMLSVLGCKKETPAPVERTLTDVENDFQALDRTPGTHDVQLEFLYGHLWNFRIIAPTVGAGEKKPLVIHLHGASGGDPDAHKATACYAEPGLQGLDAFIISPNGGINQWYDLPNQEQVINLVLLAKRFWPIDPNKIVVMGYSNGGNGSLVFWGNPTPTFLCCHTPREFLFHHQHEWLRARNAQAYVRDPR